MYQFEDTVSAEIAPVDLFSIIEPLKKEQKEKHGELRLNKIWDSYEEKKLASLKMELPQKRLRDDRVAREIVRAILSVDNWIGLRGKMPKGWIEFKSKNEVTYSSVATRFPDIENEYLNKTAWALFREGLLDVHGRNPCIPSFWCFETEIIGGKRTKEGKTRPEYRIEYMKNPELREAISSMLKPFESEKPLYINPGLQRLRYEIW